MWRSAVDVMSRYHKLDHKVLGYEAIAEGDTPLQQQLAYWQEYHDWAMEGTHHEIGAAALHWLQANKPENEPTVLCWGDSRIGNIIFSENLENVAAVLDWEMAVMGNPVQDIAWFNFIDSAFAEGLGAPRLPGLPSYEDTVAQWQQASGHSARDYDYYVVFAAMRYGLILSRIMLATDQADQVQENFASLLLKKHLQRVGALSSM
jgi:aminoglycoside phosphotransferase (APT) family kinase protein